MPIEPPSDPPRPGRIIVPGEESPAGGSRIVLPPGARVEEPEDDLPEFPRLRPLEIIPAREGDRELLLVSDPLGVMPAPVTLRLEALGLLQLLDGRVSLRDLSAEVVRGSNDVRSAGVVRDFVAQLDRLLMLDSPRFQAAYAEVREQYHRLEIRQAVLAGISYPAERDELDRFLDGHFAAAEQLRTEAGQPAPAADALPRALMLPHLDPRRAGPLIVRSLLELGVEGPPLRVIVHGVGHMLFGDLMALTRKHFETPYGLLECDRRFVDAVAERVGDAAYHAELAHRDEHSIEFTTLYLKRRLGERNVRIVPILWGGFHALLDQGKEPREAPEVETVITALREVEREQGGATLHLAAVDLSHVGPRFADPPLDDRTRHDVEAQDHEALEAARRGDAEGWHRSIAAHEDSTRVCGWGATYAMLRAVDPGTGRLLRYEQSPEPNGSIVSMAAMVWP